VEGRPRNPTRRLTGNLFQPISAGVGSPAGGLRLAGRRRAGRRFSEGKVWDRPAGGWLLWAGFWFDAGENKKKSIVRGCRWGFLLGKRTKDLFGQRFIWDLRFCLWRGGDIEAKATAKKERKVIVVADQCVRGLRTIPNRKGNNISVT